MRVFIRFSMPAPAGNRAIADGRLGSVMEQVLGQLKPEAAYFLVFGGRRTGMVFCDLPNVSDIPVICEPLFMELDAEIEILPVMNGEDLQKGLAKAAKKGG